MLNGKYSTTAVIYLLVLSGIVAISISSRVFAQGENRWTEIFTVDKERFLPSGKNPYFILEPGYQLVLEESGGDGEKVIITVLDKIKVVDNVKTRVVEEREFQNGKLAEVSRNYFAMDTLTNSVFYFGEDVDKYKEDRIVSHGGSWQSGAKGAKFGLMMPGIILLGARYYQEMAPKVAMDRAEIISMTEVMQTPAGKFSNCLRTEETTPLEPNVKEYKFYAPGIGLIKDGSLKLVKFGFIKE